MKERTMRQDTCRQPDQLSPVTLRIAEACRITGIGRSKLYELIKAGDIEVIKVGRITLVPMASLDALLARGRGTGSSSALLARPRVPMHRFLANAVITAALAATTDHVRHALQSSDEVVRNRAEDVVAERIVGALFPLD